MSERNQPNDGLFTAQRYQALLEVCEAVAMHHDLPHLLEEAAERLRHVVPFDSMNFVFYDAVANVMRFSMVYPQGDNWFPLGLQLPVDDSFVGRVWQQQQSLIVHDLTAQSGFQNSVKLLQEKNVQSACFVPLTTLNQRLGTLALFSRQTLVYHQSDLGFLGRVAAQMAVAIYDSLNEQRAELYRLQVVHERDRLRLLLEINNILISNLDIAEIFRTLSDCLGRVVQHDYLSLFLRDNAGQMQLYASTFPGTHLARKASLPGSPAAGGAAQPDKERLALVPIEPEHEMMQFLEVQGLHSLSLPLTTRSGVLGTLLISNLRHSPLSAEDRELLKQVAGQVAIAMENALAFRQIDQLKDKLTKEKLYLEEEIRSEYNFEEVVGDSPALRRVLQQVETVAPTGAAVLILGETGTGKELIARAVHALSSRRERTFVKLNCSAIPTGLLESELFGHEKGAFTGAICQKVGRLELADQGTLFLDEVGDIPLELQPKLLRLLQEQEFERLGGTRTIRVEARIVAATNRNLQQMVADRQFRKDLFYRLNVFPILVPPLRERREDIPLLVRYFTQKLSRRMNKPIQTIPTEAMQALTTWHWPGNIRELENLVERAVILSTGTTLRIPVSELQSTEATLPQRSTLQAAEREHILRALREAGGVIGGPEGAAARLAIKRTTLNSRMRKLGITRQDL